MGAGISAKITNRLNMDIGYRYLNMGDLDTLNGKTEQTLFLRNIKVVLGMCSGYSGKEMIELKITELGFELKSFREDGDMVGKHGDGGSRQKRF